MNRAQVRYRLSYAYHTAHTVLILVLYYVDSVRAVYCIARAVLTSGLVLPGEAGGGIHVTVNTNIPNG
eukprot:2584204-Rhodomonas_salina.3